jgi:hypothetical protein
MLHISFSVSMTESIHGRTPFDQSPTCAIAITLNETFFHSLSQVKWLGIRFSFKLSSPYHFSLRYNKANNTFGRLKSLSGPGIGLRAVNARRLAQTVILPSQVYKSSIYLPKNKALLLFFS